jgi:ketosteroid isomerase-like protein
MNSQEANQLINTLYKAVDNKDLNYLDKILSDDVNFRIGNYETISDKATALAANEQFFGSINAMNHTIDKVWQVENDVLCNGVVDYIRLDGSEHSAYFSTVLTIDNGKITDYFVYADISQL